ncbi:DUF6883 domain-containing protein [Rhodohalobacter sp. 8-1]|uniref:DUF6883 domain-containing protein n=1 Tax=Rhodohalobacter sp. 8-1 TaxID=3131972 RepID=UPI0030EB45B8
MRLPINAIISERKVKEYLLSYRKRSDKSKRLSPKDAHGKKAGYDSENWKRLEQDIRMQLLIREAVLVQRNEFGDIYEITGKLNGPNGKSLFVRSIWVEEYGSKLTKFITMYPLRDRG